MLRTLVVAASFFCLLAGCEGTPPPAPPRTSVTVYGGDTAYEALTEPESPWYGTLGKVDEGRYALRYGDAEQALYTKDAEAKLEPFMNQKVVVTGKLAGAGGGALLWPAAVEVHTDGLLACSKSTPQVPVVEKIASPYLESLIAQQPGDRVEPIIISFCEDQIVTPESTQEQLERLRASSYVMLSEELAPLVVAVKSSDWLTQSLEVEMKLGRVLELAGRADVVGLVSGDEPPVPPP